MENKKKYGQFFTTNYDYILQNLYIPDDIINIIEPFAGNCDLLNFIQNKEKYNIKYYDIEPKKDFIIKQDTILEPPNFDNSFILTNPPYLARNKSINKKLYDTNDLYKCFIKILINSKCLRRILILPLNFISSIRKNDIKLRKDFLNKYDILILNIFEKQVFKDTKYTICSFQFKIKNNNNIKCNIYPIKKELLFKLNNNNNYMIGGEIYKLNINNNYKIDRATIISKNTEYITNILVKCIDDNINNKIGLSIIDNIDKYIDNTINLSARTYAILIIEPKLSKEKELDLVNIFINEYREIYYSLFLTNYRESNKNMAKKNIF